MCIWAFSVWNLFSRLSWSIWTWCRWLCRFFGRFLSQGSISWGRWNRLGEFADYIENVVADFDYKGLADILGTHIGFLEADCEAKVFALANLLISLCIAFSESVTKAASSAKSMSRTRTVLTLVLVRRRARLKSLPSVEESSEWDKRREKIQKIALAKTKPCFTPLFIGREYEGHGAPHAFVVGTNMLRNLGGHQIFSWSWNRPIKAR